jgi:hypothetical protein
MDGFKIAKVLSLLPARFKEHRGFMCAEGGWVYGDCIFIPISFDAGLRLSLPVKTNGHTWRSPTTNQQHPVKTNGDQWRSPAPNQHHPMDLKIAPQISFETNGDIWSTEYAPNRVVSKS